MAERALLRPFFNNVTFTTGEEKEFVFPQVHYRTLSLVVSPRDSTGDDMTVDVLMKVNGLFVLHPVAQAGTVTMGELFFFTNEDLHGQMKVKITAGVTPPTNGIDVQLWAWRP